MISFATTFNQKLFECTGVHSVNSFLQHQIGTDTMHIGYEGMEDFRSPWLKRQLIAKDISDSPMLTKWERDNADIIPTIMGGDADPSVCKCDSLDSSLTTLNKHIPGCPYTYFNSRASKWFRKLVTLQWVIQECESDYLFWIDSDCLFKKTITEEYVHEVFGSNDIIYSYGESQKQGVASVETGFIGFKRPFTFIEDWIEFYISGEFRKEPRWDDSWSFTKLIERKDYNARDMIEGVFYPPGVSCVVACGPFKDHITHYRGIHVERNATPDGFVDLIPDVIKGGLKKHKRYG